MANPTRRTALAVAVLGLMVGAAGKVEAGLVVTYDLKWSGAAYGNSAIASGTIDLDLGLLPNPGSYFNSAVNPAFVRDLHLTVSGASVGNGTFSLSDFSGVYWSTGGGTLNMTRQLVGQPTADLPWGSDLIFGRAGDFNLNGLRAAPVGSAPFTLTTAGGSGQAMALTSFAPSAVATPEPSTLISGGIAVVFAIGYGLRRRKARLAA